MNLSSDTPPDGDFVAYVNRLTGGQSGTEPREELFPSKADEPAGPPLEAGAETLSIQMIVKVLRETSSFGPVMLGKWETELPTPVVWPKNCEICTPSMMAALDHWRDRLDPAELADDRLPDCACRKDWEQEAAKTAPPCKRGLLPVLP